MSDKKILLFLKIGIAGSVLAWVIFLSSNVGFPQTPHPIVFSISMTASSFVIAMILVSPFLYTKKERKIDKLLGDNSSVDDATLDLLIAISHRIKPDNCFEPKYDVELAQQILRVEIEKARVEGASDKLISEYLQQELDSWIEKSIDIKSDYEAYTQIIDELKT